MSLFGPKIRAKLATKVQCVLATLFQNGVSSINTISEVQWLQVVPGARVNTRSSYPRAINTRARKAMGCAMRCAIARRAMGCAMRCAIARRAMRCAIDRRAMGCVIPRSVWVSANSALGEKLVH